MGLKIKAVIFDVGGVLQLSRVGTDKKKRGIHKYVSRKLKVSIDQYFDSIDDAYSKSIEGKISERNLLQTMSKNLKINQKKLINIYKEAYLKNFKINKELLAYAEKIKKNKIKIAILSDIWYISKKILIIKKFYKIFKPVILSCDVGTRKPDKKIYSLVLAKLKLKQKEVVFVDNQEWNIKSAKEMGMNTILFKTNKQAMQELEKLLNILK